MAPLDLPPPSIDRRVFIGGLALSGPALINLLAACSDDSTGPSDAPPEVTFDSNPFTLGVASGDPTSDSVVIWTRLAVDPLAEQGAMPDRDVPIEVHLEGADVASSRLSATARAADGHSVHVTVDGMPPRNQFTYWFMVGDWESPRGVARSLPAAGDEIAGFTMAQASCARWDEGEFAAYRDIAEQRPELVVFCGDYIYERPAAEEDQVRGGAITAETLEDYRYLYALYRTDPALQAAHAAAPWVVTWDDHEVSNNYVSDHPDPGSESADTEALLTRRAAAYKAWWENMPVRLDPPDGADLDIYRTLAVGDLARIHVLDTRQYRTPLECEEAEGESVGPRCDQNFAEETTALGAEQEAWLGDALSEADGAPTWDVLAQQIVVHQWRFLPGADAVWNLDQWDGYPTARERLIDQLAAARGTPVVLTGDVHSSWAAELRRDFDDPDSEVVGTEFVASGIASDGSLLEAVEPVLRSGTNPHIRYSETGSRGWVWHELSEERWIARYRLVDDHLDPDSAVTTDAELTLFPDNSLVVS